MLIATTTSFVSFCAAVIWIWLLDADVQAGCSGEPGAVRKSGHKLKMIGENADLKRQVGGGICPGLMHGIVRR